MNATFEEGKKNGKIMIKGRILFFAANTCTPQANHHARKLLNSSTQLTVVADLKRSTPASKKKGLL